MSYKNMEESLKNVFKNNNQIFESYAKSKDRSLSNTKEWIADEFSEGKITITFPGYKTYKNRFGLVYDYRVNYKNLAVSHISIIVDLYNKIIQYPDKAQRFKSFIIDIAYHGNSTNLDSYEDLTELNYKAPVQDLLETVNKQFHNLNKEYLSKGNIPWNFSFEELKFIVSWIALQEDINYPMTKGSLQGRMMPFYRYLEALYAGLTNKSKYSLDKVIQRALIHKQPNPWKSIDYSKVSKLKKIYMSKGEIL